MDGLADYKRVSWLKSESIDLNQECSSHQFFEWLHAVAKEIIEPEVFIDLCSRLGQEVSTSTTLKLSTWIHFLLSNLAKKEVQITEPDLKGVSCLSLNAVHSLQAKKIFVLGMDEESLSVSEGQALKRLEVEQLVRDLDLRLNLTQPEFPSYQALSLALHPNREVIYSFAENNFQGSPLAASLLWLQLSQILSRDPEKQTELKATNWDFIQRDYKERSKPEALERIDQDLARQNLSPLPELKNLRVSVSQLKKSAECSFKHAAEKRFKLRSEPELDWDVDRMTKGRLIHAVLELLLEPPFKVDVSDEEWQQILLEARKKEKLIFVNESLWQLNKEKTIELAKQFLAMEAEWRQQYPKTHTIGREVKLYSYWDSDKQEFTSQPTEIEFIGFIDRVDSDGEVAYILDYKSSDNNLSPVKSWVENGELQLPLYCLAIEQGVVEGISALPAAGASYLILKDLKREKGFVVDQLANDLFDPGKRRSFKVELAQWKQLLQESKQRAQELIQNIQEGQLEAKPVDEKICDTCDWSQLCRAPHLR